jgi:hypothetical protein
MSEEMLPVASPHVVQLPDEGLGLALPQAPAQALPQVQPTDNWSQRYAGLQRSLQAQLQRTGFQRFEDLPTKAEIDALRAQAQQVASIGAQVEQRQVEAGSLAAQNAELQRQLAEANSAKGLYDILAKEAPELVPMARYLKPGSPEEVVAQIADFRATLTKVVPSAAAQTPAVPMPLPPPSAGAAATTNANLQVLVEQANTALREGRIADYRRLTAEWQAAQTALGK